MSEEGFTQLQFHFIFEFVCVCLDCPLIVRVVDREDSCLGLKCHDVMGFTWIGYDLFNIINISYIIGKL